MRFGVWRAEEGLASQSGRHGSAGTETSMRHSGWQSAGLESGVEGGPVAQALVLPQRLLNRLKSRLGVRSADSVMISYGRDQITGVERTHREKCHRSTEDGATDCG